MFSGLILVFGSAAAHLLHNSGREDVKLQTSEGGEQGELGREDEVLASERLLICQDYSLEILWNLVLSVANKAKPSSPPPENW